MTETQYVKDVKSSRELDSEEICLSAEYISDLLYKWVSALPEIADNVPLGSERDDLLQLRAEMVSGLKHIDTLEKFFGALCIMYAQEQIG